jgi:hypothetical protein
MCPADSTHLQRSITNRGSCRHRSAQSNRPGRALAGCRAGDCRRACRDRPNRRSSIWKRRLASRRRRCASCLLCFGIGDGSRRVGSFGPATGLGHRGRNDVANGRGFACLCSCAFFRRRAFGRRFCLFCVGVLLARAAFGNRAGNDESRNQAVEHKDGSLSEVNLVA